MILITWEAILWAGTLGALCYLAHRAHRLLRRRPSLDRAPGWLAGLRVVIVRERPPYRWVRDRTCGCIWTTTKPVSVEPCPQHKHRLPQLLEEKTWEAEMPRLAHKVRRSLGPRYPERQR